MYHIIYLASAYELTHCQVRIGRIAGQYAKPRSSGTEKIGDREVLSFRYVQMYFLLSDPI